jgi:hypothetical protein
VRGFEAVGSLAPGSGLQHLPMDPLQTRPAGQGCSRRASKLCSGSMSSQRPIEQLDQYRSPTYRAHAYAEGHSLVGARPIRLIGGWSKPIPYDPGASPQHGGSS